MSAFNAVELGESGRPSRRDHAHDYALDRPGAAVDNHQPSPANQAVSSGGSPRLRDFTSAFLRNRNARDSSLAAASSRAPTQGMNMAGHTNSAVMCVAAGARVINNILPAPMLDVSGNSRRPPTSRASSHTSRGAVQPAF